MTWPRNAAKTVSITISRDLARQRTSIWFPSHDIKATFLLRACSIPPFPSMGYWLLCQLHCCLWMLLSSAPVTVIKFCLRDGFFSHAMSIFLSNYLSAATVAPYFGSRQLCYSAGVPCLVNKQLLCRERWIYAHDKIGFANAGHSAYIEDLLLNQRLNHVPRN